MDCECNRLFSINGMMATIKRISVRIAVLLNCIAILAQQQPKPDKAAAQCKNNTYLVGECFRLHGRAFYSNGTPDLRIWQVGTNRILGVTRRSQADDTVDPIAPQNLLNALGGFDHFVFGDFEVCPFTPKRQGQMQMVCVKRAENLVIKPYGYRRKD
jgi:hypothetical protein